MTREKQGGGAPAGGPAPKPGEPAPVTQWVQSLAATAAFSSGPVQLPAVKAPSLEGLEVTVPQPEDITEEDLLRRFHELAREHATVREREEGEPLAMGDDVQLDVLGYANGQLIPFSIRAGHWMELAPQEMLPGFAETLSEGVDVGDSVEIQVVLPENYPVESLRGRPATFIVDVRAAHEVRMPDTDSEEFLKQLGRGATHDEVMDSILEELEEELTDLLWLEARDRVLDALASRLEVQIPSTLVDEEIRRRWKVAEGDLVVEKGFSLEEQREALECWLRDADTRAEVERRLRISLALKAVAEREKLVLDPNRVLETLQESAAEFGMGPEQLREALANPESAAQLKNVAMHLMVVEHVMNKAKIHFEGA